MSSYPSASPATLSNSHRRMLYDESGLDPGVVAERGYETVRRRSELMEFGKKQRRASADAPALRVPLHSPDGILRLSQIRPHTPRKSGLKYETPAGATLIIDVHPRMRNRVRHGDEPLLITEGAKTGDAATSRDIPTVVLAGVWGWCVKEVRPYKLRSCWDHVRLEGREVNIAFDSDCMTKENVQQALEALVRCLEERGAVVKVIYLPDAPDGSKQGIDDYLVAGGTVKEMFMLARTFKPSDIGQIRMSRDERLRAAIGDLWRDWYDGDWMHFVGAPKPNADGELRGHWARGHTARDVKEALIMLATRSGKLEAGESGAAVVVRVGLRWLSELAAKSKSSTGEAIKHLEADGQIEILSPEDRTKARRYRLFVPRAHSGHYEGKALDEGTLKSVPRRCPDRARPSAPRLRWSSPACGGRLVRSAKSPSGRTVTQAVGDNIFLSPDQKPYGKRLCPHRGAVLDVLEDAGGELHRENLQETLHREGARPRDFRRRILKPLEEAGIIQCEGDVIKLAAEWFARLEEKREADGEIKQGEDQAKTHARNREQYRLFLDRERNGTPQASHDAVKRTRDLRERRLREKREEEERVEGLEHRRFVKRFVHDRVKALGRIRLELLQQILRDAGGSPAYALPAAKSLGCTVMRLPEYENREFVFAPEGEAGAA